MAIIKFKNTYDLINYLCKKDVLGELKVSFTPHWSSELTPEFNFYYSDLDEHLSNIFSQWFQVARSAPSELHLIFTDAENFSIEGVENFEFNNSMKKVREIIDDEVRWILDDELGVEYEYADIDIEGPDFDLKNLKINTFKIEGFAPETNEDALEQVDERMRNLMLTSILETIYKDLVKGNHSIECIEHFKMRLNINSNDLEITVHGSPFISDLYDLEDGESFTLNTELLKPYDE